MRSIAIVILSLFSLVVWPALAAAESDSLLPISFSSFLPEFKKAATKVALREPLTAVNCMDGGKDKRTVCSYKLGDFMQVMAETKKGEKDVVGLTMICTAGENYANSAKCLLAYAAAMLMTAPEMDPSTRGKIVKVLLAGLDVGNRTTVTTEERRYILQKSIGLWFHIYAADVEES
ncbi:hypothetical protein V1281_006772 [Nitrobacteraceae bacterium AZCC 2161]